MIMKGQKINDRYQIIRLIGEGGMANVYLAYDTILKRDVAIKILRGDLAVDEKFVKKFQKEAIAASSLSHPNIVEMYDVGEDDGNYYIVMEYVDGATLKSLIKKRGALTLPEVIDIMLQMTSAIACAHNSYIIHRDIKPQNVMILDSGVAKIMDFGIATVSNNTELTQTNSVLGSVHYLPPEQANGSGSTIKSDIYSLGIMMYELLIGKLPFKGETAVEVAIKQLKEPVPSVCRANPSIPQSIENIILKSCAKNPKNRYDSVNQMYDDIKNALDEDRVNEPRYVYPYPEQDLEQTSKIPDLEKLDDFLEDNMKEKKMKRKTNTALWVTGTICIILFILGILFFLIYPKISSKEDVRIPNVYGMTRTDAVTTLSNLGFVINTEDKYQVHDEALEGVVIGTNPANGTLSKKGKVITLIISSGTAKVTIDDYTGKNYLEIKGKLEALGLYVKQEKQDVEKDTEYEENEIISQSPEAGTRLEKNSTVTLIVPNITTEYPDFVTLGYTEEQVKTFCAKFGVTVKVTYEETDTASPGKVISQDKPAGYTVTSGTTLNIKVAREIVSGGDGPGEGDL